MNKLLAVAIMCSLVGILIIIFVGEHTELDFIDISNINKGMIDKKVRIKGEIKSISQTEEVTFLDVIDNTGEMKIIVFENITLEKESRVEIEGKVDEYMGDLEIIAELIKVA